MRIRSSQFVFLLLLLCSVHPREEYTLHLVAGTVSDRNLPQQRKAPALALRQHSVLARCTVRNAAANELCSADAAAHRIPWPMPLPALQAARLCNDTASRPA